MSIEKITEQVIENRLANLHTCIPGHFESYDAATQKASVKPLLKREFKDGESLEYPVINAVPVVWPGTKEGILSFPINKGDGCLLIFSERSIDSWLSSGGIVSPGDRRKHSLSDAIAIPGLFAFNEAGLADSSDFVLKFKQSELRLANNNDVKLNGGTSGKVAIGNATAELLDLFEQTLTGLENAQTLTSLGPQPLINLATFTAIKALLSNIKGTL